MNPIMTLADQTLNDLALLAALTAFAAVLVVAALWTAAILRVDRLLVLASRDVGPTPRVAVAAIFAAGSIAILLGYIPSHLLLDTWSATAAGVWIVATLVSMSAMLTSRRRTVSAARPANAQKLPHARAA
jgi:hypothetical protein